MKNSPFLAVFLLFLLACAEKKPAETVQDSIVVVPEAIQQIDTDTISPEIAVEPADTLTEEEMTQQELEYEANNSENTYPQNVDEKDNVIRFKEEGFNIGAPFFERNAVTEIPAFLKSNGIKYNRKKTEASKDPDDYESTDTYVYTFGESRIEIAYEQVTSATIYSPAFEWNTIKVGMDKKDFIAQFPYLTGFYGYNQFQLHIGSFNSGCYVQFDFENDRMVKITYTIFVQDCS